MAQSSQDIHLRRVIDGFLAGDSAQFQIVQRQIARLVHRWYSAGTAECDDLVSDIVKTLLENLRAGQFRGESLKSFNSYVYGLTRFKVIRARHFRMRAEQAHDPEVIDQLPSSRHPNLHQEAAHRQLLAKIYSSLNPNCRELLALKFSLGWSDQEIADQRKMTKNAVSTAISRCIRRAQTLDFVREILYQKPPYGHYEG